MRPQVTPDRIAALSLCRAADTLEQVTADPSAWFFVILDLHRALYTGLVAAQSAFFSAGAFKDRDEWLKFVERSRTNPNAQPPASKPFVPFLPELLKMAEAKWYPSVPPLQLTKEQRADITKLSALRHDLEYVKPEGWPLDTTEMPRIVRNVAAVFEALFENFKHHLELDEVDQAHAALSRLKA
jgi:hypothetical protein